MFHHFLQIPDYTMCAGKLCSSLFTAHEGRGAHHRGLEPLVSLADQAKALELLLAGLKERYERRLGALMDRVKACSEGNTHAKRVEGCQLSLKVVCGGIVADNDPSAAQESFLAPSSSSGCPEKNSEPPQDRHIMVEYLGIGTASNSSVIWAARAYNAKEEGEKVVLLRRKNRGYLIKNGIEMRKKGSVWPSSAL